MPKDSETIVIDGNCERVFDLLHDYDRRLEWDTLLRSAALLGGATAAGKGVTSRCVGKWRVGGIAMDTEYIAFKRPEVAAVRLRNKPLLFESFAATIRHTSTGAGRCKLTYIYHFRARPKALAWVLEPVMRAVLRGETRSRLRALKSFVEKAEATPE